MAADRALSAAAEPPRAGTVLALREIMNASAIRHDERVVDPLEQTATMDPNLLREA
jgi:hypothetical protein